MTPEDRGNRGGEEEEVDEALEGRPSLASLGFLLNIISRVF